MQDFQKKKQVQVRIFKKKQVLDTGAAISLISDRTWGLIGEEASMANWDGNKLVGVEGSEIPVLGVAQNLNINFAGVEVQGGFIVASALNSEAILGLDFLENNQCCINTEQKVLQLKGRALPLTKDYVFVILDVARHLLSTGKHCGAPLVNANTVSSITLSQLSIPCASTPPIIDEPSSTLSDPLQIGLNCYMWLFSRSYGYGI